MSASNSLDGADRPTKGIVGNNRFKKLQKSDPLFLHEVTISVKQKNIDVIHAMLKERSQPDHPNYQNWLSFTEVHSLIRNDEAVLAIRSWIKESVGGSIIQMTSHGDYIRVTAPIASWERVLDTQFYAWEPSSSSSSSSAKQSNKKIVHRAESYKIPEQLREHISAIFQTSQAPVIPQRYGQRRPYQATSQVDDSLSQNKSIDVIPYAAAGLTGDSRPASLNQMYGISSNKASASLSQAVFETNSEKMSQSDLKKFQEQYSLPQQAAIIFNSTDSQSCNTNTCSEGNLDIQVYIQIYVSVVVIIIIISFLVI